MRETYYKLISPILYYRIIGPGFHRELLGFSRSCNSFELMYLVGSERTSDNFEQVKLDDHYLSHISLRRFGITKPMVINTKECKYNWAKLVDSMQEVGIKSPLIVEATNGGGFIVTEGKHRFGAATLVEPFNLDYTLPCLLVARDICYTAEMWKQKHPNAFASGGFSNYGNR